MFPTLFNVRINWIVFAVVLVAVYITIPDISIWSFVALTIATHQFFLVFYAYGSVIPIRYWAGALMCLQLLAGPAFAYSGLDEYMYFKYRMQVPEATYFAYALPAVIAFILGLHSSGRLNGERVDQSAVVQFVASNTLLPFLFIGVGFLSSVAAGFFGAELANVFYILGGFKFVGLFMLLLSRQPIKILPLALVLGAILFTTIRTAMFHDLITWLVFVLAILSIRYKPTIMTKVWATAGLILLVLIIQQIKVVHRQNVRHGEGTIADFQESIRTVNESGGFFDMNKITEHNVRINQGFIVTYAMSHVPANEPFAHGSQLYRILEAAFLPRVIAPDKLKAGDNSLVAQYTGLQIRRGTSMSLSALGDAYVNFGKFGGCIMMFCFGWLFNFTLNGFQRFSRHFPIILLFTPLVFYYPIRPDTALQTGLGHMVKASFLLWVMLLFWKKDLSTAGIRKKALKAERERAQRAAAMSWER